MLGALFDRRLRALRVAPVRTLDSPPPGRLGHGLGGREVVRQEPCEDERPAVVLGFGPVAGRLDERGEAGIGDRVTIDPERAHGDPPNRALAVGRVGPPVVAPRVEDTASH